MTLLSISQAVRDGYASHEAIYRKIDAGELPLHTTAGTNLIDSDDLQRLFGAPHRPPNGAAAPPDNGIDDGERAQLEREIEEGLKMLARVEEELRDTRQKMDLQAEQAAAEREELIALLKSSMRMVDELREKTEAYENGAPPPLPKSLMRREPASAAGSSALPAGDSDGGAFEAALLMPGWVLWLAGLVVVVGIGWFVAHQFEPASFDSMTAFINQVKSWFGIGG